MPYLETADFDGAFPVGFAGYIEVDVERIAAELVDFGFDLLPLLVEDVAEDDLCAFLREESGFSRALSARAAADECYLAVELAHGVPPGN